MLRHLQFIAFATQKPCFKGADMSKDANNSSKEEFLRGEENFMEGATFIFDLLIHLVRKAVILHNHCYTTNDAVFYLYQKEANDQESN